MKRSYVRRTKSSTCAATVGFRRDGGGVGDVRGGWLGTITQVAVKALFVAWYNSERKHEAATALRLSGLPRRLKIGHTTARLSPLAPFPPSELIQGVIRGQILVQHQSAV